MEKLDITKLKRNDVKIKSLLKKVDNMIIIDSDAYVLFPERYERKDLATLSNTCHVQGVFAIVVGDTYGVTKIPNLIETIPDEIEQVFKDFLKWTKFAKIS
jgi:D-ribose pyranose/furanose isomerase RbsD